MAWESAALSPPLIGPFPGNQRRLQEVSARYQNNSLNEQLSSFVSIHKTLLTPFILLPFSHLTCYGLLQTPSLWMLYNRPSQTLWFLEVIIVMTWRTAVINGSVAPGLSEGCHLIGSNGAGPMMVTVGVRSFLAPACSEVPRLWISALWLQILTTYCT